MQQPAPRLPDFVVRLVDATNAHDIDRVAACFTADYENVTPVHPERGFRGQEQVRRNWTQIFAGVPDVTASVVAAVEVDDRVWSEWEMRGHRLDGGEHLLRGVIVFDLDDELRARSARFYLEPVAHDGVDADRAVARVVAAPSP